MPSSKTVTVERLAEGSRRVMLDFTVPHDHELVVLEDEDHAHLVYGLPDELVAVGLLERYVQKAEPVVEEKLEPEKKSKPKPKAPAKKKTAAKKPAAKSKAKA